MVTRSAHCVVGIGKAVGRRAGCGCVLEIYNSRADEQTEGPKGMWAVESSVSTPPDKRLHDTLAAISTRPSSVRFGFLSGHGERCAPSCLSRRQASSELPFAGALMYSCQKLSWVNQRLSPRCMSALPLIAGDKTTTSQQHPREPYSQADGALLSAPGTSVLSQGAVAALDWVLWIACSVWRARVSSVAPTQRHRQPSPKRTPTALEPTTPS